MTLRRAIPSKGFRPALIGLLCGACGLVSRPPAETPAQAQARTAADERIRAEVEARLAAEPSIGAGRVRVVVRRGEVELHGAVAGFGALQCAQTNAELTPGVRLVIDFLVLESGPRQVRCLAPRAAPVRDPGGAGD